MSILLVLSLTTYIGFPLKPMFMIGFFSDVELVPFLDHHLVFFLKRSESTDCVLLLASTVLIGAFYRGHGSQAHEMS